MQIQKKQKLKFLFFNFTLLFATLASIFLIIEVFFRFFSPQDLIEPMAAQLDQEIIYTLTPNTESYLKGTSTKMFHLKTNSLGLREQEIPIKKPEGIFRILLLGDSMSMAEGVEIDEIYLKKLQHIIEEHNIKNVKTINAAIRGYGNDQELILFRRIGKQLEPNLVILAFFTGNDFNDNWNGRLFSLKEGLLKQQAATNKTSKKYRYYSIQSKTQNLPLYGFFISHSHFVNWLRVTAAKILFEVIYKNKENAKEAPAKTFSPKDHPGFKLTLAILNQWKKEVKEIGSTPYIMIIPQRQTIRDLRQEKPGRDIPLPDIEIEQFCKENKISCLNLRYALVKQEGDIEPLWLGCGHLSREGHDLVAGLLFDHLYANNMLPQ